MNSVPPIQPSPDPEGDNPLQFWVAYIPGDGEKKNYLSDGKGNLRMFKSESVLREWLKPQLRPEVYEMVVVHSVQGQIVLPDDGTFGDPPPHNSQSLREKQRIPKIVPIVPVDMQNIKPITTMAPFTVPTAQEQLDSLEKRRRRRRN